MNWPRMDPADPTYQALSKKGILLGQHDRLLRALVENKQSASAHISELCRQVSELASSVQYSRLPSLAVVTPASTVCWDAHVSDPDAFSGDLEKSWGCIFQCGLVFQRHPLSLSTSPSDYPGSRQNGTLSPRVHCPV